MCIVAHERLDRLNILGMSACSESATLRATLRRLLVKMKCSVKGLCQHNNQQYLRGTVTGLTGNWYTATFDQIQPL